VSALDTVRGLDRFQNRGPGSNAERRAARWLADELEQAGLQTRTDPFWCRPNWALAHAWHAGLGLAGSLTSVGSPRVGGALILVALLSLIVDDLTGLSLGRRLTPERASQNVIASRDPYRTDDTNEQRVRLIITANYDAGRTGLIYRDWLRTPAARIRRATKGFLPGWLAWVAITLVWLLATAVLRLEGSKGTAIGAIQFIPTVVLVLALALLLEQATARFGPGANDNASGAAASIALARALEAAPPRNVATELVLAGAGDAGGVGLRRYLRRRSSSLKAHNTVVIGLAPSGAGDPRWWLSDGTLVPLRYFAQLQTLLSQIAADDPELGAHPHRGRGMTPAFLARAARLPAIAIGAVDENGLAPRSHQKTDTPDKIEPATLDSIVEFGLILTDAVDGYVGRTRTPASAQRATQVTPE
jgi:hypothetical protein